jgi:hypothetical protein
MPEASADLEPKSAATLVQTERDAIIKIIEETARLWRDGDTHQMAEVLVARIRARTT